MVAEMRAVIQEHFAGHCVVDLHLSQHPQDEEAIDDLAMTYADASAPLPERGRPTEEVAIVTVSQASDNHRLVKLLQQAAPSAQIVDSPLSDEITFYRETTLTDFAELGSITSSGRDAYRQLAATENFSLHSRMDITDWRPIAPE